MSDETKEGSDEHRYGPPENDFDQLRWEINRLADLFKRETGLVPGTLRHDMLVKVNRIENRQREARDNAREEFFGGISDVADAIDVAANGPNEYLKRRDLSEVGVPMKYILRVKNALWLADRGLTYDEAYPDERGR